MAPSHAGVDRSRWLVRTALACLVVGFVACGGSKDTDLPPLHDGGPGADRAVTDGVPTPRDGSNRDLEAGDGPDGPGSDGVDGGGVGDGGGGAGGTGGSGGGPGGSGGGGAGGTGGTGGAPADAKDGPKIECSLAKQDCVPTSRGCYPDDKFAGETVCLPAGFIEPGSTTVCVQNGDCVKGAVCQHAMSGVEFLTCTNLCETGKSTCGAGATCKPLANYPGMGYCAS